MFTDFAGAIYDLKYQAVHCIDIVTIKTLKDLFSAFEGSGSDGNRNSVLVWQKHFPALTLSSPLLHTKSPLFLAERHIYGKTLYRCYR